MPHQLHKRRRLPGERIAPGHSGVGSAALEKMSTVIKKISYHLVGHCDYCDGYRCLEYEDQELGFLCLRCGAHSIVADIELNCGGYDLCRPSRDGVG